MVQTSQPDTAVLVHGQALPSQPAQTAALKVYPVTARNFSCRLGVTTERGTATRKRPAEILLTAVQLRSLAAELIARAEMIERNIDG